MTDGGPESTAARVALWRALHLEVDRPPHIIADDIGLRLVSPDDAWRDRPDMHPEFTKPFRASIVGRARFIEDLVVDGSARGVNQYVILGAGLDTFAQRRPDVASGIQIYEIDQGAPQKWKHDRLIELGLGVPENLHFVPVDFEARESWREALLSSGFDPNKPAIVVSTGVSMYLTKEANAETMRQVAAFAPGSTFAMSFLLPIEMADADVRPGLERSIAGARASGTPFLSFFTPDEVLEMARGEGFKKVEHVSADDVTAKYFADRTDGLRPPRNAEELLVAHT